MTALTGEPTLSGRTGNACETIGFGTSPEESPECKSAENGPKPRQKGHSVGQLSGRSVVVVKSPLGGARTDAFLKARTW